MALHVSYYCIVVAIYKNSRKATIRTVEHSISIVARANVQKMRNHAS